MIKELKNILYIATIILFIFLIIKFYFSNKNIKNYYKVLNEINNNLINYSNKLKVLESDTNNIVEYVGTKDDKKKKYYFWDLIINEK